MSAVATLVGRASGPCGTITELDLQVGGHGLSVGVAPEPADELHGVVQPRRSTATLSGLPPTWASIPEDRSDNVDPAFANNCEHGHTLPRERGRARS